jgi:hypothetical protein
MQACAFCPRIAKMTGEHLLGDWISRLHAQGSAQTMYTIREFERDRSSGARVLTRSWRSRTVNLKAYVVCEPCNNRWMSEVENDASLIVPTSGFKPPALAGEKASAVLPHNLSP